MTTVMQKTWHLRDLLEGLVPVPETADNEVTGLVLDSRRVRAGNVFFAFPGNQGDGREYIPQALAQGATAILYEAEDNFKPVSPMPAYPVNRLQQKIGVIADRFYVSPSKRIYVIGVTGTNGKTTCTQLLAQALSQDARRCAVIGTLGYGFVDHLDPARHTTPDAIVVHRLLAEFIERGADTVCMEVSSHALAQGRVNGVAFDTAIFTNLSRDHLDYHGDMAGYADAKASLFSTGGLKIAVINQDDDFGRELIRQCRGKMEVVTYGLGQGDFYARDVQTTRDGLRVQVQTPVGRAEIDSTLFGRFNVGNLLAALAALLSCGMTLDQAALQLSRARPAAGRVERFGGSAGLPLVVVDYAHTPDALEKVLQALREHCRGRLWCVFGCGGDRDRGKRPQMGRAAEQFADAVILTDDNPRHEAPEQIIADILAGMDSRTKIVRDRAAAIETAIAQARAEDIVLVAGKGHEDYQETSDRRFPYSDRLTVKQLLGEAV